MKQQREQTKDGLLVIGGPHSGMRIHVLYANRIRIPIMAKSPASGFSSEEYEIKTFGNEDFLVPTGQKPVATMKLLFEGYERAFKLEKEFPFINRIKESKMKNEKLTARNEKTSKRIAKLAAKGVKAPSTLTTAEIKAVCASVLTQVEDKKK